jgi:hypothetical protein
MVAQPRMDETHTVAGFLSFECLAINPAAISRTQQRNFHRNYNPAGGDTLRLARRSRLKSLLILMGTALVRFPTVFFGKLQVLFHRLFTIMRNMRGDCVRCKSKS